MRSHRDLWLAWECRCLLWADQSINANLPHNFSKAFFFGLFPNLSLFDLLIDFFHPIREGIRRRRLRNLSCSNTLLDLSTERFSCRVSVSSSRRCSSFLSRAMVMALVYSISPRLKVSKMSLGNVNDGCGSYLEWAVPLLQICATISHWLRTMQRSSAPCFEICNMME